MGLSPRHHMTSHTYAYLITGRRPQQQHSALRAPPRRHSPRSRSHTRARTPSASRRCTEVAAGLAEGLAAAVGAQGEDPPRAPCPRASSDRPPARTQRGRRCTRGLCAARAPCAHASSERPLAQTQRRTAGTSGLCAAHAPCAHASSDCPPAQTQRRTAGTRGLCAARAPRAAGLRVCATSVPSP